MAAIALLVDRRTEESLIADIVASGHVVVSRSDTAAELIAADAAADVVIAVASPGTMTAALVEHCDARGIRLIALATTESERRLASAVGVDDPVDGRATWAEVEAAFEVRIDAPAFAAPDAAGDRAAVVAVWGPAGAPGRTTLAIGIAAEVAASGRSVILVDADPYGGTVAIALGMLDESPGFAAACRLVGADALTAAELDRLAQPYRSRAGGFRVLTGIGRAARWPELVPSRVATVLAACRRAADVVVVDVGFSLENDEEISSDLFAPRRNGATIAVLRAADRVVAVGAADPIGIPRLLRGCADLIDVLEGTPFTVVVNRLRPSALGLDAGAQVRSTLRRFGGIERVHLVPDDQRALDAALLAGATLADAAPRSLARQAIARLVAELFPPGGASPLRRGPRRSETGRRGRGMRRRTAASAGSLP